MTHRNVIDTVRAAFAVTKDLVTHYDPPVEPPRIGRFAATASSSLHPEVRDYLETRFPSGLFTHQDEAVQSVLSGSNTIAATRTSSGKSLMYSLPLLDALCHDQSASALFLYPQKALANDQMLKLREMVEGIPTVAKLLKDNPLAISRYDGSTPSDDRPAIRDKAQVLLTNPDMLHLGIMQYHDRHWSRFFSKLKVIAVDECHEYRGVFGTNVGYILRRLRQICKLHGSDPKFVATSATVHEPAEHMQKLTGANFNCIGPSRDGSLQGSRKFWMVSNPAEHYYETGRKLALALAESGLSVLAFCPSRVSAERMIAKLGGVDPDKRPWFRVYRSGLSPKQREEIENGLRTRDVRLVFSTSALELGIDIGEIDVVVCIGLPSSMMSLWQRAGRSARGGRTGATVFIPADTPIDSYYAATPDELFSRVHEPLVLNLGNQRIVCQHYACAVQEVGGDEDRLDLEILGPEIAMVHKLRKEGNLHRDEFYRADPHMEVNVRSAGEGSYSLMVADEKIGEIDSFHLLRESYRNAVYRHAGQAYRVRDVIRGRRQVLLQREFSRNETTPFIQKKIRLKQQFSTAEYSGLRVATVALDVTEFLMAATEKDLSGKIVKCWQGSMGMPAHQLPTTGTMLLFKKPFWDVVASKLGGAAGSSLESCERLLCSLFPTISGPCDMQDYSSGIDHLPTGETAMFLYDLVYDGVDLTTMAFSKMGALVAKAEDHVRSCDCSTDVGCIRCIANPFVNQVTSKASTIELLDMIGTMLRTEAAKVSVKADDWAERFHPAAALKCSKCASEISSAVRFCPNCGEKVSA